MSIHFSLLLLSMWIFCGPAVSCSFLWAANNLCLTCAMQQHNNATHHAPCHITQFVLKKWNTTVPTSRYSERPSVLRPQFLISIKIAAFMKGGSNKFVAFGHMKIDCLWERYIYVDAVKGSHSDLILFQWPTVPIFPLYDFTVQFGVIWQCLYL